MPKDLSNVHVTIVDGDHSRVCSVCAVHSTGTVEQSTVQEIDSILG